MISCGVLPNFMRMHLQQSRSPRNRVERRLGRYTLQRPSRVLSLHLTKLPISAEFFAVVIDLSLANIKSFHYQTHVFSQMT